MKTRNGFVSNSSSSSFLIKRDQLKNNLIEELNDIISYDFCVNNIKTNIHISKDHIRFSRWYSKGLDSFEKRFPRGKDNSLYQYCQDSSFRRVSFGSESFIEYDGSSLFDLIEKGDIKLNDRFKGI